MRREFLATPICRNAQGFEGQPGVPWGLWHKARKQEDPNKFDESDVDSDEDVPWEECRKAARECNWAELRLESLARLLNIPGDKLLP